MSVTTAMSVAMVITVAVVIVRMSELAHSFAVRVLVVVMVVVQVGVDVRAIRRVWFKIHSNNVSKFGVRVIDVDVASTTIIVVVKIDSVENGIVIIVRVVLFVWPVIVAVDVPSNTSTNHFVAVQMALRAVCFV